MFNCAATEVITVLETYTLYYEFCFMSLLVKYTNVKIVDLILFHVTYLRYHNATPLRL